MKPFLTLLAISIAFNISYAQNSFPAPTGPISVTDSGPYFTNTFSLTGTGANKFSIYPYQDGSTYLQHDGKVIFSPQGDITPQLVITPTGNIGVGYLYPQVKLHVNSLNAGSGATNWIAGNFGGQTGDRVVLGLFNGTATIGSHNNALSGWSNLAINPDGGNVGIGTTDPKGKLHIASAGNQWSSSNFGTNLIVQGAKNNAIGIFDYAGTNPWAIANNESALRFATMPALGDATTSPSIKVTLLQNGNLGIGTSSPKAALDVAGGIQISATNGTSPPSDLSFGLFQYTNVGLGLYSEASDPGQGIGIWTNNSGSKLEAMRVLSGGNVGIGTTSPDEKLAVNGKIHTKEVKIDLAGWSDYVFKPAYKLKPLSEVKAYIDANQHLPEIPSESEMIKNGLMVAEMNKMLMKKVEELTLYLIEHEKRIKLLEEKLNATSKK